MDQIVIFSFLVSSFALFFNMTIERAYGKDSVSVMTFNVQNLFDTKDDLNKADEDFLPLKEKKSRPHHAKKCARQKKKKWRDECLYWDWSEINLEKKAKALAGAILQVEGGTGPDLLILQEVENLNVLKYLNSSFLKKANYSTVVLIDGNDFRGIDVAFLSRLKLRGQPELHDIAFTGKFKGREKGTRGILEATFELPGGELMSAFALHFPAPRHSTEIRVQALKFLNTLISALPSNRLILAGGDFNITRGEELKGQVLERSMGRKWLFPHKLSCIDCIGSIYYPPKKVWSYFDLILLSKNFDPALKIRKGWKLDVSATRIPNQASEQKNKEGYPKSFQLPAGKGVSDHWPFFIRLIRR